MKKIICLILMLFSLFILRAEQNIEKLFLSANKNYDEKQYLEAIKDYLTLINAGQKSDVLFYNLGNSYYKNKENTRAILSYEKALKLNPNNTLAKTNLSLARQKTADKIDPVTDIILIKAWKKFTSLFSANQWAISSLVFFWISIIMACFVLFAKEHRSKRISVLFSLLLFAISGFCVAIAYDRYSYLSSSNEAILISPVVALRVSPDTKSKTTLTLHEGAKLMIEDHIGSWYKVKLENELFGWVEKSDFESY